MADSDNTITRCLVTRRTVLAGTTIAISGFSHNVPVRNEPEASSASDPVLAIWYKWQELHHRTEQLCRLQHGLERKLVEMVGFPCSLHQHVGDGTTLRLPDEMLNPAPAGMAMRAISDTEFTAQQACWEAADRKVGYSVALHAEREAGSQSQALLKALSENPATSLAGVAAKLDAVLKEGEISEDCGEFPWPQIRSAFEDIRRIGGQMESSHAFPSELRHPKSR